MSSNHPSSNISFTSKSPLRFLIIIAIFVSISILSVIFLPQFNWQNVPFVGSQQSSISVQSTGGIRLPVEKVELASSAAQQSHGLMFRQELCDTCVVLFAFENEDQRSFWMKNTFIPLDIIFVNSQGKIVKIHSQTTPGQTTPTYNSQQPAQFVLEGTSGLAQRLSITEGDQVDIQFLVQKSVKLEQSANPFEDK